MGDTLAFLRKYTLIIFLTLSGLGLIVYGLWGIVMPEEPIVEIIKSQSPSPQSSPNPTLVVDVAGAVEHPGVYTLSTGARVSDALVSAGGLTPSADRTWLARYVNLATQLTDGAKVYIPIKGEATPSSLPTNPNSSVIIGAVAPQSTNPPNPGKININSASASELDTLWGVGATRAGDIVNNRPYSNLDELVSKAHIPKNVFDRIKDQITL